MPKIIETSQINYYSKERAFLLQFEDYKSDIMRRLKLDPFIYYGNPVEDVYQTGLFGVADALIDLKLTKDEIMDFYIHGHVEPYTNPYEFIKGIIEIIYGMPKEEIKTKYGSYFNDERIANLNTNQNIQKLLSFCYDNDDIYEFIPNKDDLYDRFLDNYCREYHHWDNNINEKKFQKIDGKLFRAVRFLIRQGYDFPEMECLLNEQIKSIVFKQTNGKNEFVLNKEYAREMSDNLLCLVYLLKRYNYKFLDSETMFNSAYDSITLINPNGEQIELSKSHLDPNIYKYINILRDFSIQNFEVLEISNLCDKEVKTIEINYTDSVGAEHSITISRDVLKIISEKNLIVLRKGFELGFTFPDSDNLFDANQEFIKVIDPNGKEQMVVRSKIMHIMAIISLLTFNNYSLKDYDNLFDEKQPYIVSYDEKNQERLLSRKQINKIIKIKELSENGEDLNDSEKDILAMINNNSMLKKLLEWLPYTAKKWIPSAAVVNKIPAEQSYEYFYNNNYARLGVLKDAYQAKNYEKMEGIVSLGYILGLFDSKESTSEKAMNYIIDYFLKKGVTADELHTTYGAIDLRKDYNKQFADFFMQHYAINSEAFIEPDLGTNMTGELFEKFNEVLENRPEKRIKTRTMNKLLTPIDAMASITNIKIDKEMLGEKANDERYICLVTLLTKFGASNSELKWAIKLYEQALALDEQKVAIPHIEDLKTSLMKFNSHLKSDPQAFISGRKTNCCSKYGGFAEDRLTHVITDSNWRYVTFTSPNRTFFDGLVWYDKKEKVVCIDNVEGQFSKMDKNNTSSIPMMADAVIRYADGIYHKMNELNIPCTKVNVGKDPGTPSWEIFKYAKEQELIFDDNNPCDYPTRNNISTDANTQFTITDEKILKFRRKI